MLAALAEKYGTDKLAHAYLPHYEARFTPLRESPVVLLEIGVMEGASLKMWRDYFPFGRIYGIDAVEACVFTEERIKVFHGRQEEEKFLATVLTQTGPFDIVVDDGSHHAQDHLVSFHFLWPHMNNGGWYAIEDCFSLFNDCWTQPGERTILDLLHERREQILTGRSDIAQVHILGGGQNDGLIFLQKRGRSPGC